MSGNINPFEEHGLTEEEALLSADLTIDPQKAWAKMSRSVLAEPNDGLVCLVETAIMQGAECIDVSITTPREEFPPFNIKHLLLNLTPVRFRQLLLKNFLYILQKSEQHKKNK